MFEKKFTDVSDFFLTNSDTLRNIYLSTNIFPVPLPNKQVGCCKTLLKKQGQSCYKSTPKAGQTMKPLRLFSWQKAQESFQKKNINNNLKIHSAHYNFLH